MNAYIITQIEFFLESSFSINFWLVCHPVPFALAVCLTVHSSYAIACYLFHVCQLYIPEEDLKYLWALVIAYFVLFYIFCWTLA